jgi:SpoVK/Ycf46/Vps4 family AAA+-type ATPase
MWQESRPMSKRSPTPKAVAPVAQERARPSAPAKPDPRPRSTLARGPLLLPRSLAQAPVLDLMCSHFVLMLVSRQGARFQLRRDLAALLSLTGRHLVWPRGVLQRLRAFLQRRCQGHEGWHEQAALDDLAFIERFGQWQGPYEEDTLFFHLDDYVKEAPKDVLSVLAATGEWLTQALAQRDTQLERNLDMLAEVLQLQPAERALLLYGSLARHQRDLRSLLVEFKVGNVLEAYAALAEVAGVDATELGNALRAGSRLERLGLLDNLVAEHNITDLADLMRVSERLPPILMRDYQDRQALMAVFTRPASASALSLNDFAFVQDDVAMLCALLAEAVRQQTPGVNVLIYGPPGTGKTELARVAAQAAGLALYEVEYADRDGHSLSGRDRYRSLQMAQVFLKGSAHSVLLFDEVEDVFPSAGADPAGRAGMAVGTGIGGKAWVNQMLEANPVPTLWVTNRIEQIDPAFRRRFAYHLELKSPPPGARDQLVRKALEGAPVSAALVARLAERPGLTPAQIGTALRFARLVATATPADAAATVQTQRFDALIERQLQHADHALGRRRGHAQRVHSLDYGIEWLHTESRHPLPRLLEALHSRGQGSLCLHGPPGSGKTALAEHMALVLQRPLMVRRASDLMGKYVGETEQHLAAMFAEAQAEQALLLLDEADSFLLDRQSAQRPHEVSEVNEMLQGMERFQGIFVCTTNLMERLDAAALRRFTFKIAFHPLRPEQRLALFAREALGDPLATVNDPWRQQLLALDQLTLGDFATVRRQAELLQETLSAEAFLAQLQAEHRLKPEVREQRPMGFTR